MSFRSSYLYLHILILILFCAITLRLWYFQIFKGSYYSSKSEENILRQQSIYAPRGLILDKNGLILAENKPAYGLAIIREDCKDIAKTLKQVSKWSEIPYNELREKFIKDKDKVQPFKLQLIIPNLSFRQVALMESHLMNWPSLHIVIRPLRNYIQGPVFSHLIGYVAQANEEELHKNSNLQLGDNVGKQGLELTYESRLRGTKGRKQLLVDAQGRQLKTKIIKKPVSGKKLNLTIDLSLQQYIWDLLGEQTGAVVVLKPDTGKVHALVSKPGYNNNLFVQGISHKQWGKLKNNPRNPLQNRAIQSCYPPGSVFKLLMAACALHHESISLEKQFYCPGSYRLNTRIFRCWKERGHGYMNLREALKQSCDVYFYKLGEKMGVDLISSFARKYGFNSKTEVSLPNESAGLIPSRKWKLKKFGQKWYGGETLNLSIGQGYTLVTPLQIARFVASLVNGGKLLQPILLDSHKPCLQKELPLSNSELNTIKKAIIAAVEEPHGTAWRLRRKDALIGGKTGTAQVVKLTEESRDKETEEIEYKYRDHAWMASFGQKDKKSYVVVVLIEHGGHGSSAAGPVVKEIFDYLFS